MLLSFLYFEWRCALRCCKSCMAKCSKDGKSTVHMEEGHEKIKGEYKQAKIDNRDRQDEDMQDEMINAKINLLH